MTNALRFFLLGIALLLFGLALPGALGSLIFPAIAQSLGSRTIIYLVEAIFPIAGVILALVGFFMPSNR